MVDAVASVLLDNLLRLLISEGRQLFGFKDQYEETKEELEYMKCFLEDANRVKQKDKTDVLKKVISDLRDLVYDVDDLMADCQLLEQNCANSSNFMRNLSPHFISRMKVGKRLHKVNLCIGKLKKRMEDFLGPSPSTAIRDHQEPMNPEPLIYRGVMKENLIVGLVEDDSKKIRGWILKENQPFMVIGIVGMGGIGKTTLAEKVCKSPDFNSHFKHSFLVSVSHTFDLADLLKRMLKKLNVKETSNEVDDLSERLKSKLDGRYLLVLDDVWQTDEKMWWDCLEAALPRRHGCCIIVTTRNDEVAKSMGAMDKHIHQQIFLSEGESWSLFKKVAFVREGDERINHELEYIGKKIVRSCGGLPLAIKIVGGMMSKESSIDEWKRISKHLKEEMSNNKKDELVSSVLRLSYDELPSHLKPCFLSFAMYPENFEINTRNMIYGWIGEGLVWGKNGKTAYEFGEQCFAELLSRCLILGEYKDAFERTFYTWKMHDLVRDLVIKIAKDENFMCVDEKGRLALSVRSRRTGIIRSSFTETFQPTTNLRALVWIDIDCKNIRRNICKLRWLRVLYLSFSSTSIYTEVWMSALGSLPHLVYLTIGKSNVKKLPNSLGNLRKLQIFRLFDCPNLKSLPPTISNLEKLTILFLRECPSIEFFPEGLGKLSKLEQLFGFKPTKLKCKNSFRIEQLKNLTELREIGMDISSKDQFEEGGLNVLQELPCLKVLAIDCSDNDGSIEFMEKLHQSLSPLKSLQELWLGDFPSRKTPPWLNPTTLPSLQRLYISRWWKLTQMGPKFYDMNQEESWKIEVLVLKYLDELEVDCPRIQKAIPKLRLVKISGCSKLKSFHLDDEGDGERNGEWRQEKDGWRRHYD